MKKIILSTLLILTVLMIYSCEDTLDPNAPFRERYVLTGVIRSDTSLQVVTVTKSYRPPQLDPYSYKDDPAVAGAEVNMWYKDTLYELRDTVLMREDSSHFSYPIHCYYVNNLRPAPDQYVDIEALLPNGLLLQSFTKTPEVDYSFFNPSSDQAIPPTQHPSYFYVKWKQLDNELYSPKIQIVYYIKGNPDKQIMLVPLRYFQKNGTNIPIYPQQTNVNEITIDMETINATMRTIARDDPAKGNYSIVEMDVQMIVYDPNLSTYYSSMQEATDGFTVKLDQPDFSNVTGGFGIFGSYVKTELKVKFSKEYLKTFGYN